MLCPQQSKRYHPDRSHEIPPLQNGQGWWHEGAADAWTLPLLLRPAKGPGCAAALKPWVDFSVAELSSATLCPPPSHGLHWGRSGINSQLRRLLHKVRMVSGCRWHMRGGSHHLHSNGLEFSDPNSIPLGFYRTRPPSPDLFCSCLSATVLRANTGLPPPQTFRLSSASC